MKKLILEILADSADDLHNVASNTEYWQIDTSQLPFTYFLKFLLSYFFIFRPCTSSGTRTAVWENTKYIKQAINWKFIKINFYDSVNIFVEILTS